MKDGFIRLAAATPKVCLADPAENALHIAELIREAAELGCGAVCFPELALTGYTCGDLFREQALLAAAERGLARVLVTCDDENQASASTIEDCGGELENRVEEEGRLTRRYWIDL